VSGVQFPPGYRLELLRRDHPRKEFTSGEKKVDDWLATKALQNTEKHLSSTHVLLDETGAIAGFFSLATGQVNFNDLPDEARKRLPHRLLPVAVLAWMGVSTNHQGQGHGRRLLAQAFHDCRDASRVFPFIAVVLDAVSDALLRFYQHWGFQALPSDPNRLFLRFEKIDEMLSSQLPQDEK
jgi:GNAT superfamily N-acetyltransferase